MHDQNFQQLKNRLLAKGFPLAYVTRVTTELEEHWEDLKQDFLDQGSTPAEASQKASERVGTVDELGRSIEETLKTATWVGRHRKLVFTAAPLLLIYAWWFGLLLFQGWASGALEWSEDKSKPQPVWDFYDEVFIAIRMGGAIVLPLLLCRLSQHHYLGYRWAGIGCAVIAIHNLFHRALLTLPDASGHGGFTWAYTLTTNLRAIPWAATLLPLLVWALYRYLSAIKNETAVNQN